jgi:hypothetical protein
MFVDRRVFLDVRETKISISEHVDIVSYRYNLLVDFINDSFPVRLLRCSARFVLDVF